MYMLQRADFFLLDIPHDVFNLWNKQSYYSIIIKLTCFTEAEKFILNKFQNFKINSL